MTTFFSFFVDFFAVLFSPRKFFAQRFLQLTSRRIFLLGFFGTFVGLLLGSLGAVFFVNLITKDVGLHPSSYAGAIKSLGLSEQGFLSAMHAEKMRSTLMAFLSPVIGYMAPHIFGGALFVFLRIFARTEKKIDFFLILECAAISLTAMAWNIVPAIGPFIAVIMVGVNLSHVLFTHYQLIGFMKVMSILSALYVCFFFTNATIALLAEQLVRLF